MRTGIKTAIYAVGFALAGAAVSAQQAYLCQMDEKARGWVPSPVVMVLDTEKGAARVIDPMILAVLERPANAKLRARKANEFRVSWRVTGIPVRQGDTASVQYTAQLNLARNSIRVRGQIQGGGNHIRSDGVCQELSEDDLNGDLAILRP